MRFWWTVFVVFVLECSAMSRDELDEFSDFIKRTSQLDLNVKKGAGPDDDPFDEDEEISDHAWEESGKFEGDLILNDRQRRLIVENVEGLSRNGLTDTTKRWPNNELIYFIQREHFNSDQMQAIERGIEDLAQASCVKFRPYRKGDRDAVVIQGSRRGCFAQVGYQGGYQVLNLSGRHPAGRGCFRHGTVVHELLHTLGFYHMQSSPDRDDYIDVKWENILQPTRHNFRKYNSFSVSDFGVGYDYDSVLHYSRKAFSANGKDTLIPKQRGANIGQRIGLSDKDTQKLNKMYCDADSNNFEADESSQKPKNKKKPKNQPFQGHGIGYHQGKTVVIKLPTSETYKLPDDPIVVFDYFSKTPQSVPSPQAEANLYGEEINPYHLPRQIEYKMRSGDDKNPDDDTIVLVNKEIPQQAEDIASVDVQNREISYWGSPIYSNENTEQNHENLAGAYEKLAKTVKQKDPGNRDYAFKINKDYSDFYDSPEYKPSHVIKETDKRFGKTYSGSHESERPLRVAQEKYRNEDDGKRIVQQTPYKKYEDTDSTYRTSLPIRKPYSSYEQTETPKYATLEYLQDRQNYSHLYSPRINNEQSQKRLHSVFRGDLPLTEDEWYKEDSHRRNPAKYNPHSYTDHVMMEHKREEPESGDIPSQYDDRNPKSQKVQVPSDSEEYYEESTESPQKNQAYTSYSSEYDENTESPKNSQAYSIFGAPVPLANSWYKPSYSNPRETYSGEVSASHEES